MLDSTILTTLVILALVFVLGCLGGLVNWGFFSPPPRKEESAYLLWYRTKNCETRFPGLVTNVVLGGVGATIFWCLHGPYAGAVLVGVQPGTVTPTLTVGQVPVSFLIGMGGVSFLLTESRRRCAASPGRDNGQKP